RARNQYDKCDPGKNVDHDQALLLIHRLNCAGAARAAADLLLRREASASFFRVDDLPPVMVGVELAHSRGDAASPRTQIPFVTITCVVDDEGNDAGMAVCGRVSDEPETADHIATNDVVDGAARRVRSLTGQYLVIVAVKRLAGADAITLLCRGSDSFA